MNRQRQIYVMVATLATGFLVSGTVAANEVGHASDPVLQIARHGADDPAGDDRGG
jgi:hypothetical protein